MFFSRFSVTTAVDYYDNVDACRACSVTPVHSFVEYVKDFTIKLRGKSNTDLTGCCFWLDFVFFYLSSSGRCSSLGHKRESLPLKCWKVNLYNVYHFQHNMHTLMTNYSKARHKKKNMSVYVCLYANTMLEHLHNQHTVGQLGGDFQIMLFNVWFELFLMALIYFIEKYCCCLLCYIYSQLELLHKCICCKSKAYDKVIKNDGYLWTIPNSLE